jgi:hypothetical protein
MTTTLLYLTEAMSGSGPVAASKLGSLQLKEKTAALDLSE